MAKKAAKRAAKAASFEASPPKFVQTVDRSRPKPAAVTSDHAWQSALHDVLLDIRDELREIRRATVEQES